MNTEKLRRLFEASKNKHDDARKMGITYQNVLNIIGGADVKASTLEKIAQFYNVPVGYFFDEAEADGQSMKDKEIERLKGQIEGLREAVRILRDEHKPLKQRKL